MANGNLRDIMLFKTLLPSSPLLGGEEWAAEQVNILRYLRERHRRYRRIVLMELRKKKSTE